MNRGSGKELTPESQLTETRTLALGKKAAAVAKQLLLGGGWNSSKFSPWIKIVEEAASFQDIGAKLSSAIPKDYPPDEEPTDEPNAKKKPKKKKTPEPSIFHQPSESIHPDWMTLSDSCKMVLNADAGTTADYGKVLVQTIEQASKESMDVFYGPEPDIDTQDQQNPGSDEGREQLFDEIVKVSISDPKADRQLLMLMCSLGSQAPFKAKGADNRVQDALLNNKLSHPTQTLKGRIMAADARIKSQNKTEESLEASAAASAAAPPEAVGTAVPEHSTSPNASSSSSSASAASASTHTSRKPFELRRGHVVYYNGGIFQVQLLTEWCGGKWQFLPEGRPVEPESVVYMHRLRLVGLEGAEMQQTGATHGWLKLDRAAFEKTTVDEVVPLFHPSGPSKDRCK